MKAIRFAAKHFPNTVIEASGLPLYGDECRIYWNAKTPLLPIHVFGDNRLVEWGNKDAQQLPRTGFCKLESLEEGRWQYLNPQPVEVIADFGLSNGVWFQVRYAIQGVLIYDEAEKAHAYIVTQPSTHYFKTMTGAERMPVLLKQIL